MRFSLFFYILFLWPCTGWNVQNNQIQFQNQNIILKGLNWFGLETTQYDLGGLDHHPLSFYLEKISALGFNSLRIPFSEDCIYFYPDHCISQQTNQTVLQSLDQLMDESYSHNLSIVLDLHRLRPEYTSPFWELPYPSKFTKDIFIKTWSILLSRYGNRTNLLGINLYNEPHDPFMTAEYYQDQIEDIVSNLSRSFPHLDSLFFVDGLKWGKDFRNFSVFSDPRIVLSIHNYGPSVIPSLPDDPVQWIHDWDAQFGFWFSRNVPIMIAEWGGRYQDPKDILWMDTFVAYLQENNIQNNFYWAWNPDSKDVGGFLHLDWTTYDVDKKILLDLLVPNATQFQFTEKYISIDQTKKKNGHSIAWICSVVLYSALAILVLVFFMKWLISKIMGV